MDVRIVCICDPKGDAPRHPDGDNVSLRDKLGMVHVQTLRYAVQVLRNQDERASLAQILATMSEHYVLVGIEAWSVVDAKGRAIDPTSDEIRERLLTNIEAAMTVSDAADGLYWDVMLPLLMRGSQSSPPTPTDESTSAKSDDSESPTQPVETSKSRSSSTAAKPSKRSSIVSIPMAATEMTSSSLDGVSSISPKSESAA